MSDVDISDEEADEIIEAEHLYYKYRDYNIPQEIKDYIGSRCNKNWT